jgi:hypothetical protein
MGLALLEREWFLVGGGELSLNLNMRPDISYAPMEGPRRTHDPVPWFQDIVISAHLEGHFLHTAGFKDAAASSILLSIISSHHTPNPSSSASPAPRSLALC